MIFQVTLIKIKLKCLNFRNINVNFSTTSQNTAHKLQNFSKFDNFQPFTKKNLTKDIW